MRCGKPCEKWKISDAAWTADRRLVPACPAACTWRRALVRWVPHSPCADRQSSTGCSGTSTSHLGPGSRATARTGSHSGCTHVHVGTTDTYARSVDQHASPVDGDINTTNRDASAADPDASAANLDAAAAHRDFGTETRSREEPPRQPNGVWLSRISLGYHARLDGYP